MQIFLVYLGKLSVFNMEYKKIHKQKKISVTQTTAIQIRTPSDSIN